MPQQLKPSVKRGFSKTFTYLLLALAAGIMINAIVGTFFEFQTASDISQLLIKIVNSCIIAIAVFELAIVMDKEYHEQKSEDSGVITSLRRTLPRFIGTVCIALSLEALIMVIKYSQLGLAGNLYYPVAIIASTAFLLIALAIFIKCTESSKDQ